VKFPRIRFFFFRHGFKVWVGDKGFGINFWPFDVWAIRVYGGLPR
jgi:hypothetical protein